MKWGKKNLYTQYDYLFKILNMPHPALLLFPQSIPVNIILIFISLCDGYLVLTLLYVCLFECFYPSVMADIFHFVLICMVWKYLICMLILTFEPAAGFMLYFLFC